MCQAHQPAQQRRSGAGAGAAASQPAGSSSGGWRHAGTRCGRPAGSAPLRAGPAGPHRSAQPGPPLPPCHSRPTLQPPPSAASASLPTRPSTAKGSSQLRSHRHAFTAARYHVKSHSMTQKRHDLDDPLADDSTRFTSALVVPPDLSLQLQGWVMQGQNSAWQGQFCGEPS